MPTPAEREDARRDRAALAYEDLIVAQYRCQRNLTSYHVAEKVRAARAVAETGDVVLDEPRRHRAATNAGHRITGDLMLGRCACPGPECVAEREAAKSARGAAPAKGCPHCLRVECECGDFDACGDMGAA